MNPQWVLDAEARRRTTIRDRVVILKARLRSKAGNVYEAGTYWAVAEHGKFSGLWNLVALTPTGRTKRVGGMPVMLMNVDANFFELALDRMILDWEPPAASPDPCPTSEP